MIRSTGSETAAKAQLQLGVMALEQKQYAQAIKSLLTVVYTYDYPEPSAGAWCEAGRAYLENKQKDEAVKAWQRVVKQYPQSKWAAVAQQRLAANP